MAWDLLVEWVVMPTLEPHPMPPEFDASAAPETPITGRNRWAFRLGVGLLLALLAGLLPAAVWGQKISKPELYGKSAQAANQALEHYDAPAPGTAEAGEYEAELDRVATIGYELAAQSGYEDFPFSFYLIDMPEPNAFALPGGHIFVTRGMLSLGLDDDMLACLLGHEIAHVTGRHGTRMQKRATLLNVLSQALVLGVLLGTSDDDSRDPYGYSNSNRGSQIQGTAAAGMVITELLLRDYSRDFEDEADVEGQRLAAAAGYDPRGAQKLWELMNRRIPQSKRYGYWRTHPFSDNRMRAAELRSEELKISDDPKPAQDYRARTQQVILDYKTRQNKEPDLGPFLERSALTAWPQGVRAEELRLGFLHRHRDDELEKTELDRDYGELVRSYRAQIEAVRSVTPEAAFLATLEKELDDLRTASEALYPKAQEVWKEGIYQTPFLEVFLSNYPTANEVPDVALALGNAYSRLRRQADAVEQYLRAAEAGPESEAAQRALLGLRNLAPVLDQPAALARLATTVGDATLAELADQRLDEVAGDYEELEYGADYLRQFPDGEHATAVRDRLETLAQNLYGEIVLYQELGDGVKALERIQDILAHAPDTAAAESLRERAVLDG